MLSVRTMEVIRLLTGSERSVLGRAEQIEQTNDLKLACYDELTEAGWPNAILTSTAGVLPGGPVWMSPIFKREYSTGIETVYIGQDENVYHSFLRSRMFNDALFWRTLAPRRVRPQWETHQFLAGIINPAMRDFLRRCSLRPPRAS